MKPGSQLGQKAKAVLECLRKHGPLNRLDLERILAIAPLSVPINGMNAVGYIVSGAGGKYTITRAGRVALGEALEITAPKSYRYCNGTMTSVYNPARDGVSRIGLARV
jgi:hypothetical protein